MCVLYSLLLCHSLALTDIFSILATETEMRRKPLSDLEQSLQLHKCKDVLNSCFDRKSKEARDLRHLFVKKFCSRFTEKPVEALHDSQDSMRVIKYLAFGFLVMGLMIFYVLLVIWRNEARTDGDLQASSYMVRFRRALNAQRKVKGY